jgi:pteridine reductase
VAWFHLAVDSDPVQRPAGRTLRIPARPEGERTLAGRAALVTGASRRLGRAIALRLADAGASLVLHAFRDLEGARRLARALEARGTRATALAADLTQEHDVRGLVRAAWDAHGALDLVVNNAGGFERTPLETLDAAAFDRAMAVNARSVFLVSTEAGRLMVARGQGAIVNLACVSGLRAWGRYIPYSASKAAVVSLTQGFARALAPHVRVNAVAPGPVLAPDDLPPEAAEAIARTTLLGRWGTAHDIAEAVLFLATQPWLTGVVLPVDGGRSAR